MFRRVPVVALAIVALVAAARAQPASAPVPDLAPGQEWSIRSTSPTTAKVIIGRLEPMADQVSVHVSIVDIPTPKNAPGAGGVTQIAHIPFEKSVLVASLDRLLATGVAPAQNFDSGYQEWREAKGGIFTISAEQAIELMFQTINRRRG